MSPGPVITMLLLEREGARIDRRNSKVASPLMVAWKKKKGQASRREGRPTVGPTTSEHRTITTLGVFQAALLAGHGEEREREREIAKDASSDSRRR